MRETRTIIIASSNNFLSVISLRWMETCIFKKMWHPRRIWRGKSNKIRIWAKLSYYVWSFCSNECYCYCIKQEKNLWFDTNLQCVTFWGFNIMFRKKTIISVRVVCFTFLRHTLCITLNCPGVKCMHLDCAISAKMMYTRRAY